MALNRQIARLSRILVEREHISFDDAQTRLLGLTLEVIIGAGCTSPASHAAAISAVISGRRTFIGGVRVIGSLDQPLRSPLIKSSSLGHALADLGAAPFNSEPSKRILIDDHCTGSDDYAATTWWDGWRAGTRHYGGDRCGSSENPLAGIVAGAACVGAAFQSLKGTSDPAGDFNLWTGSGTAPKFAYVFLPSNLWLIGLGNLGQAFLMALGSLPFAEPSEVSLMLQDFDVVSEENWATSVLVAHESYGDLKTKIAEHWIDRRGFRVRRLDRSLRANDRVDEDDPRLAFSGLDRIAPRRLLAHTGFDCIIDAGLGRGAGDFDRYRVNVFDDPNDLLNHFKNLEDPPAKADPPPGEAFDQLTAELGRCGAAEIGNASVAAPYVSAIAAATSVARAIALASSAECAASEARRVSDASSRPSSPRAFKTRAIGNAGRPLPL